MHCRVRLIKYFKTDFTLGIFKGRVNSDQNCGKVYSQRSQSTPILCFTSRTQDPYFLLFPSFQSLTFYLSFTIGHKWLIQFQVFSAIEKCVFEQGTNSLTKVNYRHSSVDRIELFSSWTFPVLLKGHHPDDCIVQWLTRPELQSYAGSHESD